MASRYRLGWYNGGLAELEANPFNVKAYKTNTVPFMSDYSSLSSAKQRLVFDPAEPQQAPYWESNSGLNALDPNADPTFWLAWTDARNMRGQLYTAEIDGQPPFARTPLPETAASTLEIDLDAENLTRPVETLTAESVEDSNPAAGSCSPIDAADAPGPGEYFPALNNRVKDSDIYGALIENRISVWSLNPTKTLGQYPAHLHDHRRKREPDAARVSLRDREPAVGRPGDITSLLEAVALGSGRWCVPCGSSGDAYD